MRRQNLVRLKLAPSSVGTLACTTTRNIVVGWGRRSEVGVSSRRGVDLLPGWQSTNITKETHSKHMAQAGKRRGSQKKLGEKKLEARPRGAFFVIFPTWSSSSFFWGAIIQALSPTLARWGSHCIGIHSWSWSAIRGSTWSWPWWRWFGKVSCSSSSLKFGCGRSGHADGNFATIVLTGFCGFRRSFL